VTGDAVNPVTRPGGITKEHGADIIVGAGARNAVPEGVFSELDRVRVKSKSWDGTFTFKAK
jgi:adenylate cyclase